MYKQDAIAYFGKVSNIAKTLGITGSAVTQWKEIIPHLQAVRLNKITNGNLEYNEALYL